MIVRLLRLVLYLVIVAAVVWSVAALWIDGPGNRTLAALVAAVSLAALVMIRRGRRRASPPCCDDAVTSPPGPEPPAVGRSSRRSPARAFRSAPLETDEGLE